MIEAVVSGSFKFKPEIDKAIEALEETGIRVLEPTKGWLAMPSFEVIERLNNGQVRPLPSEELLSTRQIEDRFLKALKKSNLLYLMNQEGYIGNSTALELGFALGRNKPIYALEDLNFDLLEIDDLNLMLLLEESINVMPPEYVFDHYTAS